MGGHLFSLCSYQGWKSNGGLKLSPRGLVINTRLYLLFILDARNLMAVLWHKRLLFITGDRGFHLYQARLNNSYDPGRSALTLCTVQWPGDKDQILGYLRWLLLTSISSAPSHSGSLRCFISDVTVNLNSFLIHSVATPGLDRTWTNLITQMRKLAIASLHLK